MTDFIITVDTSKLDARLKRLPSQIEASMLRAVKRLAIELQGYVKSDKLSGQVLHVRTGNLRSSINQEVTQEGSVISGIVGTNVEYAAIHEYGGTLFIPPRIRKTYYKMDKYGNIKQGFSKKGKSNFEMEHGARSVCQYINMPERSFLRSALKDFEPRIVEELRKAASGEALR